MTGAEDAYDADVMVVGAGPAGMAAACTLSEAGARVILLDEQPIPGGQIYRNIEQVSETWPMLSDALGSDYHHGLDLVRRLRQSRVDYRPGSRVWDAPGDGRLAYTDAAGRSEILTARRLILATGAQERPVPVPGWTLPGVIGAGAAQALMKMSAVVPDGPFVLAGDGPLLLLIAIQLQRLGIRPQAILLSGGFSDRLAALPSLGQGIGMLGALSKGWRWLKELKAAGIPVHQGVGEIRAEGDRRLEAVAWTARGRQQRLPCRLLLLHQGITPAYHLAAAGGCELSWSPAAFCWQPAVDMWGRAAVETIAVAGDGAGIAGALAAEHSGRLAAWDTLYRLGRIDRVERDRQARPTRQAWRKELSIRPFLERLFQPPAAILRPGDEVMLCRCEAVSAGEIRELTARGCPGPNQMKAFTRAGMGPCQGRMCALTVAAVIAEASGRGAAETGLYSVRPPVKPVLLADLAGLDGLSSSNS